MMPMAEVAAVLAINKEKDDIDSSSDSRRCPPLAVGIPPPTDTNPESLKTPKTPADEGIEFFESPFTHGEDPIFVYELELDPDGGPAKDAAYIRLPPPYKPYILRVTLDAGTPASKNAILKTNFPLDGGTFSRNRFSEKHLPTDFSKPIHINLPISHAGAFVFWIEYDGGVSKRIKGREGYFNIDPVLRLKSRSSALSPTSNPLEVTTGGKVDNETISLPLDGLVILTVVSKWMGTLQDWQPYFREASERGYNMLHYTPLQQRGSSGSPYSIADQLTYDDGLMGEVVVNKDSTQLVKEALSMAREDYGLLSLTDIVLNHTANDSSWLLAHPEAGFSPFNTPHLAPALELDTVIVNFSGTLRSKHLPTQVSSLSDVEILIDALASQINDGLQLWQYYALDRVRERSNVLDILSSHDVPAWAGPDVTGKSLSELAHIVKSMNKIKGLGEFKERNGVYVEPIAGASLLRAAFVHIQDVNALADTWGNIVDVINVPLYEEWEEDMKIALENIKSRVIYTRLAEHGPKLGEITAANPLVETYFTRLPCNDQTAIHDARALYLANNGWIWDADPLQNFALPPSKAYLRREVIVWGDCVKLRYGTGPEDNPWLWQYMTDYVTSLAAIFDGFRIDNCHSTPLHVGMALLDAARVVNPNLYVCAELFTGNEETDMYFVSRLGINSLIREAYNGHDVKEFSRLLYRFGVSKPIGSMDAACLTSPEDILPPTGKGPVRPCLVTPLRGSSPHALLYDLTHDNESPLHKRSAEDALSTGALVTFSSSAIGSNKGFDDLYPKLLDLVRENRRYETGQSDETGISKVKRVLNHLHTKMALEGYSEGHVHQENDYIAIHRLHAQTGKGYLLVAHTAFQKGSKERVRPPKLSRTKAHFILGATIDIPSYELEHDDMIIRGLRSQLIELDSVTPVEGSDADGPFSEIHIPEFFPPGSILLFGTQLRGIDVRLDEFCKLGADAAMKDLELLDLNVVLYRADGEERDATKGEVGTYEVPGYGRLVYAGLEGWLAPLRHIMRYNDLGHALCTHLREGAWALDYVYTRLSKQTQVLPNLAQPAQWFRERFDKIKQSVPSFLRPKYFAIVIYEAYKAARRAVIEQSSDFILSGHNFTQDLALCSIQMHGIVQTASLEPSRAVPCLAAGLPHFTSGWARCWGRDVFISLRGLFMTTGHFQAARQHILAFASTLRHGLIPNLLDSVRNPRYNSRDSPWWMLQSIQDYVQLAPDGLAILSDSVRRRFPKDDIFVPWDDPRAYAYSSTISEIIQEILQRHADGISFREHNAGPNLDTQMSEEGFNIDAHVDWETGIIFGGNRHNCGTWMDKMGESIKAGTKGVPGTPRDGAPVEITGLLKSTLRWLDHLTTEGKFPFKGVQTEVHGHRKLVTYKEWNDLIQMSFERSYYVPSDREEDTYYVIDPNLVNQRGIYKDVFGSGAGREWSDYQLRPNFPIAMTVAPELFNAEHALKALKIADKFLRGPLGMKTLDPSDLQYRGDYDNSNDSSDGSVARGMNYHNGPEWGWPLGYFLRAYLYFDIRVGKKGTINETLHHLHTILLGPRNHIKDNPWRGLPELTNRDGAHCHDSCATQAWSSSTILDFLYDVNKSTAVEA